MMIMIQKNVVVVGFVFVVLLLSVLMMIMMVNDVVFVVVVIVFVVVSFDVDKCCYIKILSIRKSVYKKHSRTKWYYEIYCLFNTLINK